MKTSGRKGLSKPAVIVEIGNDWLKIAQTEPYHGGLAISRIHLERFDTFGTAHLSQLITNAFKKHGFDRVPVIACLPRQLVNVRMIELPSTDPEEIASMADIQVAKQTPYSRDEIVFDYKIVKGGRDGYTRVMMAIVQDSIVRDRFHILETAGIDVGRMSVSSEGLLNWYAYGVMADGEDPGQIILLDVDSFYSDFMVVSSGALMFTRSILMGTNQLQAPGKDVQDKFALEVKRSLEACQGESPSLAIRKLLLTGAGPHIKDLGGSLQSALSLPVEMKDSIGIVEKTPRGITLTESIYRSVSLTAIIGAGLATAELEFNLTPDSVKLRKGLEENARGLTVLGMLVMAILVSFSIYGTSLFYLKKYRLAELTSDFAKTVTQAQDIAKKQDIVNEINRRTGPEFSMVKLVSEIHACLPANVLLESLDINVEAQKDHVHLSGTAGASGDVSTFLKNLEQSPILKDAKEDGARARDKESGKYNFKILCSLEAGK
jgi:hypothetical protein